MNTTLKGAFDATLPKDAYQELSEGTKQLLVATFGEIFG